MRVLHSSMAILISLLLFQSPVQSQFQNLKPILLQPNGSSEVVVPNTPVSGLDFDWSDVAGATYYRLELTRILDGGGTQVSSVTSTISRILYSSSTNPLVPGTSSSPNLYAWKVIAYQGTTASQPSNESSFSLMGGTKNDPPKPDPGENPPAVPTSLSPVLEIEYTLSKINKNGVLMQWSPISGAAGYEVQLVRAMDEDGGTVENLQYRLDVAGPQALVSNLTLFGTYRFEVRTISSLGSRSDGEAASQFQVVQYQAADIYPESPDPDGVIDQNDLFSLALDWHCHAGGVGIPQARNRQADIVSADKFIEQADLVAFLIQFHGAILKFPPARPTPTPVQLAPATLLHPNEGEGFTLDQSNDVVTFTWDPVTNADSYQLFVRNTSTSEYFFFETTATEFPLAGYNFEEIFLGGGDYTWEVLADASGFIQSQSERRNFTITLSYVKTGKAMKPERSWIDDLFGFFTGSAAEAADLGVNKDDTGLVSPTPRFPFLNQVITTTSPFPIIWSEVPNATSYAVEVSIPGFIYFNLVDHVRDSENLNIITDDVVGDGVVIASFFSTLPRKNYQFRVQARQDSTRSLFSGIRQFEISQTGQRPYVNIDYSGSGDYEGEDVLVYSKYWRGKNGDSRYDQWADLAPSTPNGQINVHDLIRFVDLFQDRRELPRYPPIDPPILVEPEDGSFFGPETVGQKLHFAWDPPVRGVDNLLVWEMELNLPTESPTPLAKQFFIASPDYTTYFSGEGVYSWRVRAVDEDGTRGAWSISFAFIISLDQYQPILPDVVSPVDGAIMTGGAVNFEWSRVTRENLYGTFDRLEIQNGDGPIVALDIYHRHGDLGTDTVLNSVPLAPNFGPDFRWRVSTIFVIRDTFYRLFMNKPADIPEWHSFTLKTSHRAITGLAAWNPDLSLDGHVDLNDFAQFQKIWRLERNGSPVFVQEADFNLDMRIGPEDAEFMGALAYQGRSIGDNGHNPPVPTFPVEPTNGQPPVIQAQYAQGGMSATWGQLSGYNKYLVEWIDSEDNVHALYSNKMPSPELLTPVGGEVISLPNLASTLTVTWTVVPDAVQYSAVLVNVNTGKYYAFIVDAGDPLAETFSLTISREELENYVGGAGTFEYRVLPIAPGHFADTSVIETFGVSFSKDGSDYYSTVQPIVKSKPPIVVEGNGVLPAFSYYGLYSWRVMGLGDDESLTKPTKWNRFGIQCLGPAYGEEVYCGQEEPGP
jgi:hypothetical protein